MSLSRETMMELMALADGELEGEAEERAERLAAQSEEARQVVASMRGPSLRVWLDGALESRRPSSDGIADAVMARLAAAEGAAVRDGSGASASLARKRVGSRRASRLRVASALAVSVLAMAAAVAIYVRPGDRVDPLGHATKAETAEHAANAGSDGRPHGVEVDEVDSASHVSIFEISALANASAPSSVVVWVDDEQAEK